MLTLRVASKRVSLSVDFLRAAIERGALVACWAGNKYLVAEDDLEHFLKSLRVKPKQEPRPRARSTRTRGAGHDGSFSEWAREQRENGS